MKEEGFIEGEDYKQVAFIHDEIQVIVKNGIEDEVGKAIIDGIANGLYDDIPIWENKTYREKPVLCDGDGPINKFRIWVSQFYK